MNRNQIRQWKYCKAASNLNEFESKFINGLNESSSLGSGGTASLKACFSSACRDTDRNRNQHRAGKTRFEANLSSDEIELVGRAKSVTGEKTDRGLVVTLCRRLLQ